MLLLRGGALFAGFTSIVVVRIWLGTSIKESGSAGGS